MNPTTQLVMACGAMALLTFAVGIRMYMMRIREMKRERIHPQKVALSGPKSELLKDTRAVDNYNHLFELPVLFYLLCGVALATAHIPTWLTITAWLFVLSRFIHSIIQCTSNHVLTRFKVFILGYFLLAGMWIGFLLTYWLKA